MIYTWKCRLCGQVVDVHRSASEYNKRPTEGEVPDTDACIHGWDRYYSKDTLPGVPFEQLKNSGVFADDNGNFAPRKL